MRRRHLVAMTGAAVASFALAPGVAHAARVAVGVSPGTSVAELTTRLERHGYVVESLAPVPAVVVRRRSLAGLADVPGVRYVERLQTRLPAYEPNDPYLARQWYVSQNRAYDAWTELPPLARVRVAVIDSGVDAGHPELADRIAATRSFVRGSATRDTQGHGTFVAGLIAAQADNSTGIAGISPAAELLVAKVVTPGRSIPVLAEVKAIRWAVKMDARVINLSFGGVRDPLFPGRDTYSQLEADAVAYAVSKGVLVVAAVGNGDQSPEEPWRYASYPAALPHVLGVSALGRSGASPPFSNRDAVYNDLAAPGQEIFSTFPRELTKQQPECVEQGYSSCAADEYRNAEGTSFAAPQVSAAAATLFGLEPNLRPDQVAELLTRTAVDATRANGCRVCPAGRDAFTGWGRLDVTAAISALAAGVPAADRLEPNDGAGRHARQLWGPRPKVTATLDFWDDQDDVYTVRLRKGQKLFASLQGPPANDPVLAIWKPGTTAIDDLRRQDLRARVSSRIGPNDVLGYRAPSAGLYYLHVKLPTPGWGSYRLLVSKS